MTSARTKRGNGGNQKMDTPNTEDQLVGRPKRPSGSDTRVAVFVKISSKARDILDTVAVGSTRASVIENLLESLAKQSDPLIRERILKGENPNALKEHGELLQLRSWAEHAFQNERYVWAAEMYRILEGHHACSEGLKNICRYRISVCLIRLSYDIRQEALEKTVDKDCYETAIQTLDTAIAYTMKVKRDSPDVLFPNLVFSYNLASCYSLKAQYMIEQELEPEGAEVIMLRNAGKTPAAKAEAWKTIGQQWRKKQPVQLVDYEASQALAALREISGDGSESHLSSERMALADSSTEDEDFIFLRSDNRWQESYEKWKSSALKDRKPNSFAVRELIKKLPPN